MSDTSTPESSPCPLQPEDGASSLLAARPPRLLTLHRQHDTSMAPSLLTTGDFERYMAVVASRLTTTADENLESELHKVVITVGKLIADSSVHLYLFDDTQQQVLITHRFSHSDGGMIWHVSQPINDFPCSLRHLRWFEQDHCPRVCDVPKLLAKERSRALREYDAASVLNIPLWAGPRQYGALLLTLTDRSRGWSESDVTLLKIFGQVLASGIAHAHMKQTLTERERRFRAIVNYASDWEDWLDPQGKVLYINPAVQRLTGYSVEECLSMPDYPLPIVHEDDRKLVSERLTGAIAGSSGNDLEFRIRTSEGTNRWIAVSWQPIFDESGQPLGTRSSMRDITRRKTAERRMKTANDALRSLINSAPDSAALVEKDGRVVAINQTLCNLLGRPREQIIGQSVLSFLPRSIANDRFNKGLQVMHTGQPVNYEGYMAGRTLDVHFKPIFDEDGKPHQIAVFARDVTEERQASHKLKEAQSNLKARVRERTRELASANEALKEERQLLESKNAALQEIFKQIEQSKTELSARIRKNIERAALPVVERLRHHSTETGTKHLALLMDILTDIASPLVDSLDAAADRLTPREVEICTMVRNGFSCKQIAESLGVSVQTILKQRARIRRKLGLAHQKTNLTSYLTALERKRLARRSGR
jgi:PAS domain S-box-containing protein